MGEGEGKADRLEWHSEKIMIEAYEEAFPPYGFTNKDGDGFENRDKCSCWDRDSLVPRKGINRLHLRFQVYPNWARRLQIRHRFRSSPSGCQTSRPSRDGLVVHAENSHIDIN